MSSYYHPTDPTTISSNLPSPTTPSETHPAIKADPNSHQTNNSFELPSRILGKVMMPLTCMQRFVLLWVASLVPSWEVEAYVQNQRRSTSLSRERSLFSTKSRPSPTKESTAKSTKWYPTRIQEDVDYNVLVQSLYLRHIVVETKEAAQFTMDQYLVSTTLKDPFGDLAAKISACAESREESGKVGWIDLASLHDSSQFWPSPILPRDVFEQLVDLSPKTGDVHMLQSDSTEQVHIVRVEEMMIRHRPNLVPNAEKHTRVGSHTGRNAIVSRRKLKGQGVMPKLPDVFATQKSYHIQTNGCQMNVADSERLAGILENELQLTLAEKPEKADLVLFNTCSIRDHAEQKLYDLLGPYCARKRKGEEIALVVTGCVAQQEGEELLRKVPELDVVLGPQYVPFLSNVLEQIEWGNQLVATAPILYKEDNPFAKPIRGHSVRGFVNTIFGCNEHCTYCVVPATRGYEQSRPMESVLKECLDMAESGYREITLLGQNIDAYGRDMTPRRSFSQLLGYLNSNLPSKMRIRYTTSHPRYMSNNAIDAIADLDKVCESFHVPFQAGDNDVLKRMRRGYTFESYMKIIERIRSKSPGAGIFGDVIVGFPGETEEAFQRTLNLMEQVKFDNLNTFAYSPRPNTEAAEWGDQISEDIKKDRLHRVQYLAAKHGLERSQRYLHCTLEVLVEDTNPRNSKQVMGRTRQGRQVYFDGEIEVLRGEFVPVRITEARTWSLMGEMVP